MDLDVRFTGNVTVGGDLYRPFAEEDFDALRWKVARQIAALKAAAEGAAPATATLTQHEAALRCVATIVWRSRRGAADEPTAAGWIRPAVATPLDGEFTVDGKLDEPCYKTPPGDLPVRPFHVVGSGGAPYRTETRLFAKGDMLYIGIRCEDDGAWLRARDEPTSRRPRTGRQRPGLPRPRSRPHQLPSLHRQHRRRALACRVSPSPLAARSPGRARHAPHHRDRLGRRGPSG